MTPTTVVLLQELERWNKLVDSMKQSLLLLQKALVGEIGMSLELEELAQSLFIGGIPSVWRKLAPDTQKSLANWLVRSFFIIFYFYFFPISFLSLFWNEIGIGSTGAESFYRQNSQRVAESSCQLAGIFLFLLQSEPRLKI
jgi:hypothetical protein